MKLNLSIFIPFLKKSFHLDTLSVKTASDETPDIPDLISKADELYESRNYADVYSLLNHSKFFSCPDVLWRISRVLYKLSSEVTLAKEIRSEMLNEASKFVDTAMSLNDADANVHVWMAIVVDAKYGCESTSQRVAHANIVKRHLLRASELDPKDYSVWYMLGYWHYSMSSLSWFQRQIAYFLFDNPPKASYEEAYQYFLKAEELKPRYYIPNIFMLGKVSYYLKQHFRAKYYLNIAANLPPHNEYEKKCIRDARALELELELFDLTKNALLDNFLN